MMNFFLCALLSVGIRFAFLTDIHYSEGSQRAEDLKTCIRDINSRNLDFVIVGGDLTDFGSDAQIRLVRSALDSLEIPFYAVAGNHDAKWSESGCNTFREVFGYENFCFSKGGWRFVGCNSGPDLRMAPALLPKESMLFLENLPYDSRTVFVNHYPLDSSVLNYFDITRELKRFGTRMVLGGHWHTHHSMEYDSIPGAICRSDYSQEGIPPGYDIVSIEGDELEIRECVPGVGIYEPWYRKTLVEITPDGETGLPDDYPWMRFDVNGKYPQVRELWAFEDSCNIASGFAADRRRAYYALEDGRIRAVSLADGSLKWTSALPGKVFSTPALYRRRLVVGCADGAIYILSAAHGRILHRIPAGASVLGSAAVRRGVAYIGASDGVFRAIRIRNGKVIWENRSIEGFVECRPWVDRRNVIFGTWGRMLYCLDASDGKQRWTWSPEKPGILYSPASCWPVVSRGKVFVAAPDRRLHVLDLETGEELRRFEGGRESVGLSPDGGKVYVKTMFSSAYAVDAGSLDVVWSAPDSTGYEISPTPLLETGGVLLIPTDKGNLIALDPSDGSFLWAHKISVALVNPMLPLGGGRERRLLVSTMDGKVALLVL